MNEEYDLHPRQPLEEMDDIRSMGSVGVELLPADAGLMQAAVCYASQADGGFPYPDEKNLPHFTVGFTLECLGKLRRAWLRPEVVRERGEDLQLQALNRIQDFEQRIVRRAFS